MFFASAAFLAGLVLLAIPWWLHRLNAHAAEQLTFSSLFLMRPSAAPVSMRRQLQHLVLLALRCLLLLAICLAFAEPVLRLAGAPAAAEGREAHRLFVIDASLSMNGTVSGESFFNAALDETRRRIARLPDGVKAGIVTAADQLDLVVPLTEDRGRLAGALSTLKPGAARLAVSGLMGRIATLADTLSAPGEQLEVHFLSDFQASGMPDQFNALVSGAGWPVQLVPLNDGESIANRAITGMRASAEHTLSVTIRSFAAPGDDVTVLLHRNGTEIGREIVYVPENGTASATFTLPEPEGADARRRIWTAELTANDALAADNVRRLVSEDTATTILPVLTRDDRAWAYLRAAVQAGAPRFLPERVRALEDGNVPLVAVLDAGALTGGLDRILARYLESGGAVLMTAGIDTRAAGRISVLDLPLAADRFNQMARGVTALDRSHPALAGFTGWQDLTFFQVVSTAGNARAAGEVILALDDGTPLLSEHRLGAGRLMLLGSALDPGWSTLVVRPAFVGLLTNLLGYLAGDLLPTGALVGEPFAIPARNVQLFAEDGGRILGLSETVGRPTVRLAEPGIYELRTPASSRYLAANVDPAESDLRRADAEILWRWQATASGGPGRQASRSAMAGIPAPSAPAGREVPLAPWLLILLALLVVLEPLLANLAPPRAGRSPGTAG